MDIICVPMQKGGCAKTTTSINTAAVLGLQGYRTLLVDLDPQASASRNLGINEYWNIFEAGAVGLPTELQNVELVPGGPGLVNMEMSLTMREDYDVLRRILSGLHGYDYIILDCPPNLYGSTVNAIVAADRLLIPFPLSPSVIYSLQDTMALLESLRDKGRPVPERIAGVVTIYRKAPSAEKYVRAAEQILPVVLETRIRMSNYYARAEARCTAAALLGGAKCAPLIDHRDMLEELRLLQ